MVFGHIPHNPQPSQFQTRVNQLGDQAGVKVLGNQVTGNAQRVTKHTANPRQVRQANMATARAIKQNLIKEFGLVRGKAIFNRLADKKVLSGDKPIMARDLKRAIEGEVTARTNRANQRLTQSTPQIHSLLQVPPANRQAAKTMVMGANTLLDHGTQLLSTNIYSNGDSRDARAASADLRNRIDAMITTLNGQGNALGLNSTALRNQLTGMRNALLAREGELTRQEANHPLSKAQFRQCLAVKYRAAEELVRMMNLPAPDRNRALQQLTQHHHDIEQEVIGDANKPDMDGKTAGAIMAKVNGGVAEILSNATGGRVNTKNMEKMFTAEFGRQLSKDPQRWHPIVNTMSFTLPGSDAPVTLRSTITPAARTGVTFDTPYNGVGVSSLCTREGDHAVNLARTQLHSGGGRLLFEGVRHGVHSAYGLERGSVQRGQANAVRAKETMTVMAQSTVDRNLALLDGQDPITLDIPAVSLSLLAPVGLRPKETHMLRDQTAAWNAMSNNGQGTQVTLRDRHGNPRVVTIRPQLATFNFPVNARVLGKSTSVEQNTRAFGAMFGGNFLETGTIDPNSVVGRQLGNMNQADLEKVLRLANDCRTAWQSGHWNDKNADMYYIPSRLAMISHLMGTPPAFNCKSGKDRTGHMDISCKVLAQQLDTGLGSVPTDVHFDRQSPSDKHLRTEMALHSGNLEMHEKNTGLAGSKVSGSDLSGSFDDKTAWKMYKGHSKAVLS